MKYDLNRSLRTFDGKQFVRPVLDEAGQPVIEGGRPKQETLSFREMLESACLNANPQEYSTGERKMQVFNLLMKIHGAGPYVDLSAEEVSLLKALIGQQMTVGAVGVLYHALEHPVSVE